MGIDYEKKFKEVRAVGLFISVLALFTCILGYQTSTELSKTIDELIQSKKDLITCIEKK